MDEPTPPSTTALALELETAYEELRVADEEVRTQQDAIERLVQSHKGLRLQQERTMAVLPVPMIVTDMHGTIRSVNAAVVALAGVRADRLRGRPIFGLFEVSDRQDLRRRLTSRSRADVVRTAATLVPWAGEVVDVDVIAYGEPADASAGEISWIVLTGGERTQGGAIRVARSLSRLALLPRHVTSRGEALRAAVEICHDDLDGETHLSAALGPPLQPVDVVSTSEVAQRWDGAQVAAGEGPSATAYARGETVVSTDVAGDARWPRLAEHLAPERLEVLAAPLVVGDEVVGALTTYAGVMPPGLEEMLELFAATLGGVFRELDLQDEVARLEDDMRRALESRAVIDQAKGIVMASRGVDAEGAWRHLVELSSTTHQKVRDIAEGIVARAPDGG